MFHAQHTLCGTQFLMLLYAEIQERTSWETLDRLQSQWNIFIFNPGKDNIFPWKNISCGLVGFHVSLCFSDAARAAWFQSGQFLKTSRTSQNPPTPTQRDGGRMKRNLNSRYWHSFINNDSKMSPDWGLEMLFSFFHLWYWYSYISWMLKGVFSWPYLPIHPNLLCCLFSLYIPYIEF